MTSIVYERHRCLEAARSVIHHRQRLVAASLAHQRALEALAALGAKAEVPGHDHRINSNARVKLPTEDALSQCRYQAESAWRSFCQTLEESPQVQAEIFCELGCQ